MIRVRFAPSPTGNLHIGGARTALFNWLYARAKQGQFVLRIEDTDAQRSKQEYVDEILGSLSWLGFSWDEVYYQSQRLEVYREHAQKLLAQGKAYVEKSEGKGEAIIYKIMPETIKINDLIRGEIVFDTATIKDQVLIKSDGTATYNFACVVDDALMNITHVIRGDDHISNTPKQVILYNALGFSLPAFAHLPLIMGTEGGRLSKRTGATAISDYRAMGFLPGALANYLLLLSWSPKDNREIIDMKEAMKIFDITDVNTTAATFDMQKLTWINGEYIKQLTTAELADLVMPFLAGHAPLAQLSIERNYLEKIAGLFQSRMTTLAEFPQRADSFFTPELAIEEAARAKYMNRDFSCEFSLYLKRLETLTVFDTASIEACFRQLVEELHIEAKVLIHPLRVALTGKTVGPGLFDVIYYLGKERTKARLEKWIKPQSG
jgi:glutamyl-tRNA synthetase